MTHTGKMTKVLLGGGLTLFLVFMLYGQASARVITHTVDCGAGRTVTAALKRFALKLDPVIITIEGTCIESVSIRRNDVTLKGALPGDGLQAPSPTDWVLQLNGAHRITLDQLTLTGGEYGLLAGGSSFWAENLHITGAAEAGVLVVDNASGTIVDSKVEKGGWNGVQVLSGGSLWVKGGLIDDNVGVGVYAESGGSVILHLGQIVRDSGSHGVYAESASITLWEATIEGSGGRGAFAISGGNVLISGSGNLIQTSTEEGLGVGVGGTARLGNGARVFNNGGGGVRAFEGGNVNIFDGKVDFNTGHGVELFGGSTASIVDGSIIDNNTGDGIHLRDTSVASFASSAVITNNGGHGVICDGAPAVAQIIGTPGTVTGNGTDAIACP